MTDGACNYDASATQDDGSCDFETCDDCYGIPHGVALLDSCGICDADITNDNTTCSQDCDGVWGGDAVTLWGECYAVEGTTNLNLSSSGLTGEIPSEIWTLTNLDYLYLQNNQLTGEIPVEIGNLTNLNSLNLSSNQLTGEIPVEIVIKEIVHLPYTIITSVLHIQIVLQNGILEHKTPPIVLNPSS